MGGASDVHKYSRLTEGSHSFFRVARVPAAKLECARLMEQPSGAGTGRDPRAFRDALAARRERLALAARAFALALFVLVAASVLLRLPEGIWVPAAGFLAVAALVFRMTNWKCPACGEPLPTRRGGSCRGCGAAIDE